MFFNFIKYVPEKEYSILAQAYYYKECGIITINTNHITSITKIAAEIEGKRACLLVITTLCGLTFVCEPKNYEKYHKVFEND